MSVLAAVRVGARLSHAFHGPGVVTAVDGDRFTIAFDEKTAGTKEFLAAYAPVSLESDETKLTAFDGHAFDQEVREETRKQLIRRAVQKAVRASEEPPGEPFDAGLLVDVLARPSDPPMRCDGLIPSDASTLVVAQRKTGKTTFELNYARALITGEPLLGRFDTRPLVGNVALLNYEVSGDTVAAWAHDHAIDGRRLLLVNLRGRRNPFSHPEDRARLAGLLRAHDVEAVIVDPFGRAYTGKSQNDSGEVGAWLVDLDTFVRSEAGATDLLLSAHAGWNGERTRGASALEDWADVIVTLTRGDGDDEDLRYVRAIGRDVDVDEDRLDFHPPTRTLTLAGAGSRRQAKADRQRADLAVLVVRAAHETPGIGVAGLIHAVRAMDDAPAFREGEISKAAKYAAHQGLLRIEGGGPGRRSAHFAVDPTTPANPCQTPAMAAPQTPATPALYGRGRGLGSANDQPLPNGEATA